MTSHRSALVRVLADLVIQRVRSCQLAGRYTLSTWEWSHVDGDSHLWHAVDQSCLEQILGDVEWPLLVEDVRSAVEAELGLSAAHWAKVREGQLEDWDGGE